MKTFIVLGFFLVAGARASAMGEESIEVSASVPLYSDANVNEALDVKAELECQELGLESAKKVSRTTYFFQPRHYPTELVAAAEFLCE